MLPSFMGLGVAGMGYRAVSNLNDWQDIQAIHLHLSMVSEDFSFTVSWCEVKCISRQLWGWAMDSSLWSFQHGDHAVGKEVQDSSIIPGQASGSYLSSPFEGHKAQSRCDQLKLKHSHSHKHKCPVCASSFLLQAASEEEEPGWLNVGELDPGRIGRSGGCCAKALIFVRSLIRVGYIRGLFF